jgi:hypothetical protein
MRVIIKNTLVELPDLEAQLLLHRGIAHLPEQADQPTPTRYESSGIQTPHLRQQDTARKPRKQSPGSSKKATK